MAIARAHLINAALARWYHCVTRCVRRAFLLGEGQDDRKAWIHTFAGACTNLRRRRRRILSDG